MTLDWPWPILQQGPFWFLMLLYGENRKSFNGRNLQQMTRVTKGLCLYKNSDPKVLSAPRLYTCIKTWKIMYKIRLQRYFLKLATNGRNDKGFLLTSKVCPQGVFCPYPRAIYMYKIINNVYIIRFWRDHFETCNIWTKRKGLSVVIKILSPMDCLPLPWGYISMVKHEKNVYKIGLQSNLSSPEPLGSLVSL